MADAAAAGAPPEDDAVPIKQALVLINTFVTDTTSFLNRFAAMADDRLRTVEKQIVGIEKSLLVLEGKLNSVEGLTSAAPAPSTAAAPAAAEAPAEAPPAAPAAPAAPPAPAQAPPAPAGAPPAPAPAPPAEAEQPAAEPAPAAVMTVREDPAYSTYFAMLRMRVPMGAVKVKMSSEGHNPDLLDTPDAPSPNASALAVVPE